MKTIPIENLESALNHLKTRAVNAKGIQKPLIKILPLSEVEYILNLLLNNEFDKLDEIIKNSMVEQLAAR